MASHTVTDLGTEPPGAGDRLVTLPFLLVTLATFAYFIALGALIPTLPHYVEDELGGDGAAVGLVAGSFAVSAALLRPFAGRLGDLRGRRILVVGGSLLAGTSILAYSLTTSIGGLVALRLVTGVGEAAMWVGAATAVQDMAPGHRRGEAASYFSVALYAGLALGPAVGERTLDAYGFDAVWYLAGGAALVATLFGIPTPKVVAAERQPFRLYHPSAIGPGTVLFLGLLPFVAYSTFLAVYGAEIGIDDTAPLFFTYAGLVLLIRVFGAKLPDRLGWKRASSAALLAAALSGAVMAVWGAAGGVWVATVGLAIGMSLLFPALFSATVSGAPEDERSLAVGTFSIFFDLANAIGAPVLGLVVVAAGERGAFAVAGAVAAGGLVVVRRLGIEARLRSAT